MVREWILFAALLAAIDVGHGQTLTPSRNHTVPDNQPGNVSYSCTIPPTAGLDLYWEVNSLQLQSQAIIEGFKNLGIFIQDGQTTYESSLIITAQARRNLTTIPVQCLALNLEERSSDFSEIHYVNTYGPPNTPTNLDVIPHTDDTLLITWGTPTTPSWFPVMYNVSVFNLSSPSLIESFTTSQTSLEYTEQEMNCNQFDFVVFAFNPAGESGPVNIMESIPLSPDFTATDATLTIDYVDVTGPTSAEISVSFQRALSCSERFRVTNHSVVVVRGDGEVVRERSTTSSEVDLQLVLDGIERDTQFSVQVEACNIIACRRSSTRQLLTTDVQSAAILFFETFVSLDCTFASGSLARGCVVTLQLEEGAEEGEEFRLRRENGTTMAATQCNRTENSRMAYQVISAADWESDGSTGSYSIPVAANVTDTDENFPCPTGDGGGDDGLSVGAIVGIVLGAVAFVTIVILVVVAIVFIVYHRTREVKKKGPAEISMDMQPLMRSTDTRSPSVTRSLYNPLSSAPTSTTEPTPYASSTLRSTASLTPRSLQTSLAYGPVCEISMQKEGKLRMKFMPDTLKRCKESGRKKFHLLPLLDHDEEEGEEGEKKEVEEMSQI